MTWAGRRRKIISRHRAEARSSPRPQNALAQCAIRVLVDRMDSRWDVFLKGGPVVDPTPAIQVREILGNDDLRRVPTFEQRIWHNPQPTPPSVLRVWADHGGAVWVAAPVDAPDDWVGLAVALPARDRRGWYLHSDLTGVLSAWRSRGIGRRLKERQRDWARRAGYSRIGWTFDPLRARNAWFNLQHLNARVVAYYEDYYGILDTSLTQGYPTDRLFVEWPVGAEGPPLPEGPGEQRIRVPRDIEALLQQDPGKVRATLLDVRRQFQTAFAQGWVVAGFEWSDVPCYVLRPAADLNASREG